MPGWFQASLTLFDAKGNELTYADHYRFHPDPVLHYVIPHDGQYTIEIHDSVYRGREDFVYRIALGELPFVTGIFPLGGRIGAEGTVELTGWNLPLSKLPWHTKDQPPGVYPLSVHKAAVAVQSRAVRAGHPARVPGTGTERLAGHRPAGELAGDRQRPHRSARRLGRVQLRRPRGPGDRRRGLARRLDSPLDSVLKLTDADRPATGLQRRS